MNRVMVCVAMLILPGLALFAQKETGGKTCSSLDLAGQGGKDTFPAGLLKFTDADLAQVLNVYRELSGRTIIRSTTLPSTKISIESQTALTRIEALQALDSVLAQNGIVMIPQGTKFVKAVRAEAAAPETAPFVDLPPEQLPDSGTYITYIVEVKHVLPRDVAQALQPFGKMPNSILAIDSAGLIVLRDYSANVRRMLQVLERVDKAPVNQKPEKAKTKKTKRAKIKG